MPYFRIGDAARLLGISDDTLRRWVEIGRLNARTDDSGRLVVEGKQLAELAVDLARTPPDDAAGHGSARNRFVGLVTAIRTDTVMAQVELQAGPHRIVALISRDAVDQLGLEIGAQAVGVIKATNVTVEVP